MSVIACSSFRTSISRSRNRKRCGSLGVNVDFLLGVRDLGCMTKRGSRRFRMFCRS